MSLRSIAFIGFLIPDWSSSIVNLMISAYSVATVIVELARCMALFPNLHTFQIVNGIVSKLSYESTMSAFAKYTYPSIRVVVIPCFLHSILKACPEVRDVYLHSLKAGPHPYVLLTIKEHCGKIEALRGHSGQRSPEC